MKVGKLTRRDQTIPPAMTCELAVRAFEALSETLRARIADQANSYSSNWTGDALDLLDERERQLYSALLVRLTHEAVILAIVEEPASVTRK